MPVIHEYPIKFLDTLTIPHPAILLSAIEQNGDIVIYSLVEPNNMAHNCYKILVLPTGQGPRDGYNFLSTVKIGQFVYHIFYKLEYITNGQHKNNEIFDSTYVGL